ncbi:apoptosis-associated speck-like protein containing a CARD [Sardina pilchardus]|uniref:apoptosis-associated speck-like protein containing a CARD n=1 Tax=Sardina pilchardus TaxID=27697 RepID=UPI002E0FF48E
MTEKTIKFWIIDSLESLSAKDLKKFKVMLCDREEEPRVTRRAVEDADEMDLADLLVKLCTESKAAHVTIDIFKKLGFNNEAAVLASKVPSGDGSSGGYTSNYMTGGVHFIDKHRISLIERITTVDPILDRLLMKKVITQENYSDIRCLNTSYKKMRELFEMGNVRSSVKGKDCLYEVLMESEPFVMEELKERS